MTGRLLSALLVTAGLLAAVAELAVHWRFVVALLGGFGVARYAWRRLGVGARRPRASWAQNVEAVSLAYAAWNTRHLGPQRRSLRSELRQRGRRLRLVPAAPSPDGEDDLDGRLDGEWPKG